jgi:hypothetical protein
MKKEFIRVFACKPVGKTATGASRKTSLEQVMEMI